MARPHFPRLLLIEDHPELGPVTQDLLQLHGYEVHLAASPEIAFQKFSSISFDAALLDLKFGADGGVKLMEKFRSTGRIIPPLVIVSGEALDTLEAAARATGAGSILQKPFSGEQLREAVETTRYEFANR